MLLYICGLIVTWSGGDWPCGTNAVVLVALYGVQVQTVHPPIFGQSGELKAGLWCKWIERQSWPILCVRRCLLYHAAGTAGRTSTLETQPAEIELSRVDPVQQ